MKVFNPVNVLQSLHLNFDLQLSAAFTHQGSRETAGKLLAHKGASSDVAALAEAR